MKIGLFTETFWPQVNGVVVSACNINRVLKKRGHNVSVFTVGEGSPKHDGYNVYRFKGWTFKPYPEYKFLLPNRATWREMKSKDLDIIHSRTPYPMGMIAEKLSKSKSIPIVTTFDTPMTDYIHYVPFFGSISPTKELLRWISKSHMKWYYNKSDIVTAPSETTKKYLLDIGIKKEIRVISNGVDIKKFSPKHSSERLREKLCPNGEKLLLHIGRITKEKGVEFLVKSVADAIKGGAKIKFVVVGDGPMLPNIKEYVKLAGLSKDIVFTGYLTQEEIPKYYATADLFVTASPVETQGIVLLESMSSGTPVIGVNAGAIPELVKNNKNGFVFQSGDPKKLKELVQSVGKTKQLSAGCMKTTQGHRIEDVASKIEKVYRDAISGKFS